MAANLHPDVRLRHLHGQFWLAPDGSIMVSSVCEVIGVDGQKMDHNHGYTHRIPPHTREWVWLARIAHLTLQAHHDHLGLNHPDPEALPPHLYPGFAGLPQSPQTVLDSDADDDLIAPPEEIEHGDS